jgi:hypothetical protein
MVVPPKSASDATKGDSPERRVFVRGITEYSMMFFNNLNLCLGYCLILWGFPLQTRPTLELS